MGADGEADRARERRNYLEFVNGMRRVSQFLESMLSDDSPTAAAQLIDWKYVNEWARNLLGLEDDE